ncbi:MAG: alginate export family protein [Chitinophagales bacterium]
MKKSYLSIIFSVFFLCFNLSVWAQFKLSGEIRPRLEINNGYRDLFAPGLKTGVIFSQRSRLNLDYEHSKFAVKLSVQDVRIWGDEPQLSLSDPAGVSLHEAWGKVNLCETFSIQLGRQEWVYDDQRLLGNVGWAQQARSHDGVLMEFKKNDWKLHMGGAYNNESFDLQKSPYTIANYRALVFTWYQHAFKDKFKMSWIGIANGMENIADSTLYFTGTFGPHFQITNGNFEATATFYYQIGKLNSVAEVRAFMAAISAGYKVKHTKFSLGADYLSGNDAFKAGDTKARAFNTLYATNHKFYGHMDYFINVPAQTAGAGLLDIYASVQGKIGEKSTLKIAGHYFLLGRDLPDPNNIIMPMPRSLGGEIDASYSLKIHEMVDFSVGWSVMLPTTSLDNIDSGAKGRFNNWAWTMITFKPVFFQTKEKEE